MVKHAIFLDLPFIKAQCDQKATPEQERGQNNGVRPWIFVSCRQRRLNLALQFECVTYRDCRRNKVPVKIKPARK